MVNLAVLVKLVKLVSLVSLENGRASEASNKGHSWVGESLKPLANVEVCQFYQTLQFNQFFKFISFQCGGVTFKTSTPRKATGAYSHER